MEVLLRLFQRRSIDPPPELADAIRIRDEFIRLFERDHPKLQWCVRRLCEILHTFETDFRRCSTEGSRRAGAVGRAGGVTMAVGLLFAPFTAGISLIVAIAAAGGVAGAGGAGVTSLVHSSKKKEQMERLRKDIEEQMNVFKEKINPMAEKIKDICERAQRILRHYKTLDDHARELGEELSGEHLQIKDIHQIIAQMSETEKVIANIEEIYGAFSLALNMISVVENTRLLEDMDKLAGKFIAEMRRFIHELQKIVSELQKTEEQLSAK